MPVYVTLYRYTQQGISKIKEAPERIAAAKQRLKDAGAEMIGVYMTQGQYDLVAISKWPDEYTAMKFIMAQESSKRDQGVPSFEYNPADNRFPTLFELTAPLDELEERLLHEFAGKRLTMKQVYLMHNVGRPYIERNYKDALMSLEANGRIQCQPPATRRRKGTMGPTTVVTFPKVRPRHVA